MINDFYNNNLRGSSGVVLEHIIPSLGEDKSERGYVNIGCLNQILQSQELAIVKVGVVAEQVVLEIDWVMPLGPVRVVDPNLEHDHLVEFQTQQAVRDLVVGDGGGQQTTATDVGPWGIGHSTGHLLCCHCRGISRKIFFNNYRIWDILMII